MLDLVKVINFIMIEITLWETAEAKKLPKLRKRKTKTHVRKNKARN